MTDETLFRTFKAWAQTGQIDALFTILHSLEETAQRQLVNALSRQVAKSPEDIAGFAYLQGRLSAMVDTVRAIHACIRGEGDPPPPAAEF